MTSTSHAARPARERYLHTGEVAKILDASPKTISRWAKEGKLPCVKTLGGHRRFPEDEIRRIAAALHVAATTGPAAR
jgi:excisionase family DNA binding protein